MEDKKIIDPDDMARDDYKLEMKVKVFTDAEGRENPRLLVTINMPAETQLVEVTDGKGIAPFMVIVSRADREVPALGILEKAKLMLISKWNQLATERNDLTRGIRNPKSIAQILKGGNA